ncbi:ABC transporter substrate-binding protein [Peribacillus sp. SCS-155]|uniref:ABC transporter substrate-binding protein n=1 Tax=Peribacillus sedimenti TaxID=3115297 RepID=UPI003905E742
MRKKYQKLIMIFLAALMVFSLAACGSSENSSKGGSKDEKRKVKIGYLPITHAMPLFIESEDGKENFKNIELELVKFGSWPELLDALNTGRIDGASVLITLAMKAKESGIDLKAVALGHRDGNVLVVNKDINKIEDLKGKSFAIPHKFSTHNILLHQALKQAGMKYEDVKAVELPPAEMPAALSEGRIAGYVVAEPFGAVSVALDKGKVLYQDQDVWKDSIDCALVLRNDFIQEDGNYAQELVNEYVKAGETAEKKDSHVHDVSSKFMKVDKKVMDVSLKWISYDELRIDEASYDELTTNLKEMKLLDNPPSYKDFIDNTLIDKAK